MALQIFGGGASSSSLSSTFVSRNLAAKAATKRALANYAGASRATVAVTAGTITPWGLSNPLSSYETNLGTVTGTNADDTWTTTGAHGLAVGDRVRIASKTDLSFIDGLPYYVRSVPTSTTYTLFASHAASGSIADLGSDGSATLYKNVPLTEMAYVLNWTTLTITATTDLFTSAVAHGLTVDDAITVGSSTAGGVVTNTRYYVKTTPTATTFTVSATKGGTTLDVTSDGTGNLHRTNPKIQFLEGRPVQRTTSSPTNEHVSWDYNAVTVGAGLQAGGEPAGHVISDDATIELLLYNDSASTLRVYSDDVLIDTITAAQLAAAGVSTGNMGLRLYTFPSARSRRITVRGNIIVGFRSTAARPLSRPTVNPGPRVIVEGDSFTEATGATTTDLGYTAWLRRLLGWNDIWRCGSGSTGYKSDGTRLALQSRYQNDIIAQNPDVCIIAMGLNDDVSTSTTRAATVTTATTIWDAITTALPDCELVIIGPWPAAGGVPAGGQTEQDAALAAAAATRGLRFISPIQQGVTFTRADATHPDDAGHKKLGAYVAGHLMVPATAN